MVRSRVIFVVPAYNEETTISDVIHSLKNLGDVVVVNDAPCAGALYVGDTKAQTTVKCVSDQFPFIGGKCGFETGNN